jgi:hypothetical protein
MKNLWLDIVNNLLAMVAISMIIMSIGIYTGIK